MTRPARLWARAVAAAAIIGIAAFALLRGGSSSAHPAPASAVPDVPLAAARFGPYIRRIHAQGRVGAPSGGQVKLAFAGTGIVARFDVRVGDIVGAGQPLAELDRSGVATEVAQARGDAAAAAATYGAGRVPKDAFIAAEARLDAARGRLRALDDGVAGAQSDRDAALAAVRQSEAKLRIDGQALDRATRLFAGGVLAGKDVEAARAQLAFDRADADANRAKAASTGSTVGQARAQAHADVTQAESDVQSARAQITVSAAQAETSRARLAAAQLALSRTTLRATARGVVSAMLKAPGEETDATQPVVVLTSVGSTDVTLTISGADARTVRPGDAVTVSPVHPGPSAVGRVRSVVRGVDPVTQTATVVVNGVPPGALNGDAVDATIDVDRRFGIVIPTSAVVEDPGSGKLLVFVRSAVAGEREKFIAREITIDGGDDERTLVRAGLHAGERVAAQGAFDLLAPGGG